MRQITDTVVVMRRGSIVEAGETEAVLDNPSHPYTQLLRSSVPKAGWDLRGLSELIRAAG